MVVRILLAALLAGMIGGAFSTIAQAVKVVPIILEAEHYEGAEHSHGAEKATTSEPLDHLDHDHEHAASVEPWTPADGIERMFYTLLANMVTGVGYALVLAAVILVSGRPLDIRTGMMWGLAGFATLILAPAVGLPPELPGTAAAAVGERQMWWLATVFATGIGLALLAFRQGLVWMIAGVALIVAPHIIGTPKQPSIESAVPAELAAEFAVVALVTAALGFVVIGAALGWLVPKFAPDNEAS